MLYTVCMYIHTMSCALYATKCNTYRNVADVTIFLQFFRNSSYFHIIPGPRSLCIHHTYHIMSVVHRSNIIHSVWRCSLKNYLHLIDTVMLVQLVQDYPGIARVFRAHSSKPPAPSPLPNTALYDRVSFSLLRKPPQCSF